MVWISNIQLSAVGRISGDGLGPISKIVRTQVWGSLPHPSASGLSRTTITFIEVAVRSGQRVTVRAYEAQVIL